MAQENTLNRTEQGGAVTVIGGTLKIATGGAIVPNSGTQASAIADLTDNSGGAAADGTIGAVTAPTALTDSSTGSASATLAALSDLSTSDTYTDAAVNAKLGVIKNAVASLAARQAENRTAVVALTDAVKELSTKINLILAAERGVGVIASS